MKKFTILVLVLTMLILGGCGTKSAAPAAAESTPEPTMAPTPTTAPTPAPTPEPTPEPIVTEDATVVALYGMPIIEKLMRGDTIEVLCDVPGLDSYSIVRHGEKLGIMAKQFFGENNYSAWEGYTVNGAKLYSDYDFNESSARELTRNARFTVLDEFDICYRVENADGLSGYIANDELTPKATGSGKKAPAPSAQPGLVEGQDIILGYEVTETEGSQGTATVRCDKAPLLAALYDYDETLQVLEKFDKSAIVYAQGLEGEVESRFLLFPGETPYSSWTGYAANNAGFFKNIRLIGKPVKTLSANEEVTVLNKFDESYLVSYKGEIGYMDLGEVYDAPHHSVHTPGHGETWTPPIL